jgi:hypothetical protein
MRPLQLGRGWSEAPRFEALYAGARGAVPSPRMTACFDQPTAYPIVACVRSSRRVRMGSYVDFCPCRHIWYIIAWSMVSYHRAMTSTNSENALNGPTVAARKPLDTRQRQSRCGVESQIQHYAMGHENGSIGFRAERARHTRKFKGVLMADRVGIGGLNSEDQLRSALLAYGVDKDELDHAISLIDVVVAGRRRAIRTRPSS